MKVQDMIPEVTSLGLSYAATANREIAPYAVDRTGRIGVYRVVGDTTFILKENGSYFFQWHTGGTLFGRVQIFVRRISLARLFDEIPEQQLRRRLIEELREVAMQCEWVLPGDFPTEDSIFLGDVQKISDSVRDSALPSWQNDADWQRLHQDYSQAVRWTLIPDGGVMTPFQAARIYVQLDEVRAWAFSKIGSLVTL